MIYAFFKRSLDILVSLCGLIILSPVLLITALLVRLSSKGPAIFRQERAGLGGKPFALYKFRTMRTDIDPFGASPKSADDPRLTRTGRFLRERSLDELPQLLNVAVGQMSLVGPRPLYVSQIAEWNEDQKRRLLVKPGLTGLAQISGRGALTRERKLDLDVEYVDKRSFWLDIRIICATFALIFRRKSIYEEKYSQDEHTRGQADAPN
ncbi:MAG: sugar transferase [Planctomycetota bacterium]|nr:MAG: sugar transferase [Planctomycetota bacterium]